MGQRTGAYRLSVGRPEGETPFGKPRRRWEETIKTDIQEDGRGNGLDQFGEGQGQMASAFECSNELSGIIRCWEFLD